MGQQRAGVQDHYEVLAVARNAPPEVVRAAWQALCRTHHPDRNPGNPAATARIAAANAAYEVLADPLKRRAYDRALDAVERAVATTRGRHRLVAALALMLATFAGLALALRPARDAARPAEAAWMRAAVDAAAGRPTPRALPDDPGTALQLSVSLAAPGRGK